MPTIGLDDTTGLGGIGVTTATPQVLMNGFATRVAVANEKLKTLGFHSGSNPITAEIGICDLSDNNKLIASAQIAAGANERAIVQIPEVNLIEGHVYGPSWRVISDGSMLRVYEANASVQNSLDGTSPLPTNFSEDSSLSQKYAVFGLTVTDGISDIDGDDQVVEGQTAVPVTGVNMPTSGAVVLRSSSIETAQTVVARTAAGFTWDEVVLGDLPYTDANHAHVLAVDDGGGGEFTRSLIVDPPAGFQALPVLASSFLTSNDSIGAGLVGTAEDLDQFKLPTEYVDSADSQTYPIVWETDGNGNLTGRILSMGGSGNATLTGEHWDSTGTATPRRQTFTITTQSGAVVITPGIQTETIYEPNADTAVADASNVTVRIWNAATISGAPVETLLNQTLSNGVLTCEPAGVSVNDDVSYQLSWTAGGETRFLEVQGASIVNIS